MDSKTICQTAIAEGLISSTTKFWKAQKESELSALGYLFFLRDQEMDKLEFEEWDSSRDDEEYKGRIFGK